VLAFWNRKGLPPAPVQAAETDGVREPEAVLAR
jgi:hypothetical protein